MSVCFQVVKTGALLDSLSLVAQSRVDILQQAFSSSTRSNSLQNALVLLSFVAFAFALTHLAYSMYKRHTTRVVNCPQKLFRELSRAHRIPYNYRRCLERLARVKGLSDPCQLFVDPSLWTVESVENMYLLRSPRIRKKLAALQGMLFSQPASPDDGDDID